MEISKKPNTNNNRQIKALSVQKSRPKCERFIFDNVIKPTQLRRSESECSIELLLDDPSLQQLQDIPDFIKYKPMNYEDEFNKITLEIKDLYKEFVTVIYQEKLNISLTKGVIDTPLACIRNIKEISKALIQMFSLRSGSAKKQSQDYEILLQKAEAKLRDHIRNEQQLKVAIETLQIKIEDNENLSKKALQEYNDGNKRLNKIIKEREDEVSALSREIEDLREKISNLEANNKVLMTAQDKSQEISIKTILPLTSSTNKLSKARSDKSWGGSVLASPEATGQFTSNNIFQKTPTPTRVFARLPLQESLSGGMKTFKNQISSSNRSGSRESPIKKLGDIIKENVEYENNLNNEFESIAYQDKISQIFQSRIINKPPLREREKSLNQEKSITNINPSSVKNKEIESHVINVYHKKMTESVDMNYHKIQKKAQQYDSFANLRDLTSSSYSRKKNILQEVQDQKKNNQQRTFSDMEYESEKMKLKASMDPSFIKTKGQKSQENLHQLFNKSFTSGRSIASIKGADKFTKIITFSQKKKLLEN